jgi:hypothetical protein
MGCYSGSLFLSVNNVSREFLHTQKGKNARGGRGVATITFWAGEGTNVNDLSGSGIGFYGPGGYGQPVVVGQFNDNTYITNATGDAVDAVKVDNVKYVHPSSGQITGSDTRVLREIPNYLGTLNIRFTNGSAVKTQNAQLRIYDRIDENVAPVGVQAKVAVLIHPGSTQTPAGSGDLTWQTPGGSGSIVNWSAFPAGISPGSGGLSPLGSNTSDTIHDFFCAISVMPTSIGGKPFGLAFSTEFL